MFARSQETKKSFDQNSSGNFLSGGHLFQEEAYQTTYQAPTQGLPGRSIGDSNGNGFIGGIDGQLSHPVDGQASDNSYQWDGYGRQIDQYQANAGQSIGQGVLGDQFLPKSEYATVQQPYSLCDHDETEEGNQYMLSTSSIASPFLAEQPPTSEETHTPSGYTPATSIADPDQLEDDTTTTEPPNYRAGRRRGQTAANPKRPKRAPLNKGNIPGYLDYNRPLPAHARGLVQICRDFPNHLRGEMIDEFIYHGWGFNDVWNNVKDTTIAKWVSIGVIDEETLQKNGFLSNRFRTRYKKMKAKGVTRDELLAMPSRFISEIGTGNGLTWLNTESGTTRPKVHSSRKIDEAGDNGNEKLDKAFEDGAETTIPSSFLVSDPAQSQFADDGDNATMEGNLELKQDHVTPLGSFYGYPFWKEPGDYDALVKAYTDIMKNDTKVNDLITASVDLIGVEMSVKLNAKLALFGWSRESSQGYVAACEDAQINGNNQDTMLACLPTVVTSKLVQEVRDYLSKPEVQAQIEYGVIDQSFVIKLRQTVMRSFANKMFAARKEVQRQWMELQQRRRQAFSSIADKTNITGGLKRKRENEGDTNTSKKARLEQVVTPQIEDLASKSQSKVAVVAGSAPYPPQPVHESNNDFIVGQQNADSSSLSTSLTDNEYAEVSQYWGLDVPTLSTYPAADLVFHNPTDVGEGCDLQSSGASTTSQAVPNPFDLNMDAVALDLDDRANHGFFDNTLFGGSPS